MKLRGHHLICLNFLKEAFNPEFTAALKELRERALGGEEIKVIEGLDDLCARCPMLAGDACAYEDEVREMDVEALEALGLEVGARVRMAEVREKLKGLADWLAGFCEGCEFKEACGPEKEKFLAG